MALSIVLAPTGSAGDVHPFIAIARALQQRGHRVVVATSNAHRVAVERAEIAFFPVHLDMPSSLPAGMSDPATSLDVLVRQVLLPQLKESFADISKACRGADILVCGPLSLAAPLVAEKLGIPWLSVALSPTMVGSAPPAGRRRTGLRTLVRHIRQVLFAAHQTESPPWTSPIENFREELGLPRWPASRLNQPMTSPCGTLAVFSKEFAREQPNWLQPVWITGFTWYDRADASQTYPPGLSEFLSKGDPPIVFTLGDSAAWFPGDFYGQSLEAVRRSGNRAVFVTGTHSDASLTGISGDKIMVAEYAPYSQVFPHSAAVVHSGGIGAIALCLRARRPMLLTPWAFDQPDNAGRAASLGVARVLDRPRYKAKAIEKELQTLLSNPDYARRANEVGSLLDAEDGAAVACEQIERAVFPNRAGL